jgi:hypothetical protein
MLVQTQIISTGPASIMLQPPGATPVTRDVINRIWSDVVKEYPYQSLQLDPSGGGGAAFVGATPDEAVIIQPPLVQVRELVGIGGVPDTARKIAFVLQAAVHHLSGTLPVNLGVKLIYRAPAPGGNAIEFLRSEFVKGDDDMRSLAGGMEYEASVKLIMKSADVTYTLLIEPLHADLAYLYLDLDTQYQGVVDITRIAERIGQAESFLSTQVRTFLDRRGEAWTK